MKKLFMALMCFSALVYAACGNQNKPGDKSSYAGKTLTDPSAIDPSIVDDQVEKCWEISLWCDGTTIGVTYEWGTEQAMAMMAKTLLTADLQVHGEITKKVTYVATTDANENTCTSRTWEGAECWEETISYGEQSETNYGWMPEANMIERHNYYQSKGLTHTYQRAAADDEAACEALNPQDSTVVNPGEPSCWEVTIVLSDSQTQVVYMWGTEANMQSYVSGMAISGQGSATYKPAEADDADACAALNAD